MNLTSPSTPTGTRRSPTRIRTQTATWRASHQRRSLLYRYSPNYLHFAGGVYETSLPDWVQKLTPAQQAVREPPYIYHRPLIEGDGVTVIRPTRENPDGTIRP